LQVHEDVPRLLTGLAVDQIWSMVGTSASIGFHALHIAGATDRLLTYARGEPLTDTQLASARDEKKATGFDDSVLIARVQHAMDRALAQLGATPDETLLIERHVGRKMLPSTTLGVIAHAAEHATRHCGQIATLRRVLGLPTA
jgi:uncharacterized damage-inducible protein DinB